MLETESNDLSDDADYAASIQQASASMVRSDSSKQSSCSEADGAELVYLKNNVSIHPTQYASERISGRLKLIKEGSSLFLTWIPYKGQNSNTRLSERDKNLYTIRAVSFSEIRSIRRHSPTIGWQYVIVVLSSGLAFPPLYFYSGGVRDFLATIKQNVYLVRSAEDANVFLVNDFQDPLQRTLSSFELPRVSFANEPSPSLSTSESPSSRDHESTSGSGFDRNLISSQLNGRHKENIHDPALDLSIQVLEKFSLVTRFARETASQLFGENIDGFGCSQKRYRTKSHDHPQNMECNEVQIPAEIPVVQNPLEKDPCRKQSHDEEGSTTILGSFELIDSKEVDKLILVWGKPRQPPLGPEEWATFLDSEGRVMDVKALRKRIFYGGVEHTLREEVWPFLLEYHAHNSTYAEREYYASVKKSEYESLKRQWQTISIEQAKRFTKYRERKGLIEKDVVRTDRSLSFYEGDDNPNVKILRDILLTYSFYNFDLGYCQVSRYTIQLYSVLPQCDPHKVMKEMTYFMSLLGMSDLLSPILFVLKDESEAFWCFATLMERLGPNFNRDQNGMHSQLFALSKLVELLDNPLHNYFKQNDCLNYFFCFRWILIQFKREFEYEKTLCLWEVLWTHYLSEHLHLYVCMAILKKHRSKIMGERMDFDTLLRFINELSGQIDLDLVLRDAEALCICAGENGAASIPPGTPPSLPIEDGSLFYQQDDVL